MGNSDNNPPAEHAAADRVPAGNLEQRSSGDAKEPYVGGTVIWVCPCGKEKGQKFPAIIVRVKSERRCYLQVFSAGFLNWGIEQHYQPARYDPTGVELGSWSWPLETLTS